MEKNNILGELEKIKMEFAEAKKNYDAKERQFTCDLESSLIERVFAKKQHLQVSISSILFV